MFFTRVRYEQPLPLIAQLAALHSSTSCLACIVTGVTKATGPTQTEKNDRRSGDL